MPGPRKSDDRDTPFRESNIPDRGSSDYSEGEKVRKQEVVDTHQPPPPPDKQQPVQDQKKK
jgi:hypothetical protein